MSGNANVRRDFQPTFSFLREKPVLRSYRSRGIVEGSSCDLRGGSARGESGEESENEHK